MENSVPDRQIKQKVIDRMGRCGVCHHTFVPDDVHVVSRKPAMWTMVVECEECHARSFVAAVLDDGDPREAKEALQDLSRSEFDGDPAVGVLGRGDDESFDPTPPLPVVTTDDVIDVHEFLSSFDGDFNALFARG
ncbi:MAG: Succinyl-CoA:3-ketoacid-coenzyme A transferase subunit B [uncultured Thermomicrobiales bacterium]|uniref:Succinyl-CoA:3-ketoacid-coenzyme A transferase subunit B n=1 Tax=uncultured Thermomicrobiales bacterium TaxID=1645740 RepID=A0A6J4VPU4_9BACT|nr:MAG: Succinyl-CoA:3-ketoacid-coenzyme A transferase subunit B [uncultured Thermomicrobiales bacterium]